jgi:asparagine synthase (glutamine-hydrolysing)
MLYARTPRGWAFASQAATLAKTIDSTRVCAEALAEAVHYRWLVGDRKLPEGVRQVLPGHRVELSEAASERVHRYWTLRFEPEEPAAPLAEWVDRVDKALHDYFRRLARRYNCVGVLLSGGVDSSLLAAIAREHFDRVIAVTPQWSHGDNPELDRARAFAQHLEIEHRLPAVEDGYIRDTLLRTCDRLEQPPRHYHLVALARALDDMPPEVDAVIYGEAADTLFGSVPIKYLWGFSRRSKQLRAIPRPLRELAVKMMPDRRRYPWNRWSKYLTLDTSDYMFQMHAIESPVHPSQIFRGVPETPRPNPAHVDRMLGHHDDPVAMAQAHLLFSAVVNHFELIDRMTSNRSFDVLHPFITNRDIELARRLPHSLLTAGEEPKPVLKELGCKYLRREWMYVRKQGFAVPTHEWLDGPLSGEFAVLEEDRTKARGIVDVDALLKLDRRANYELYFTALCLELCARSLFD